MKKRWIALGLAVMLAALSACGGGEGEKEPAAAPTAAPLPAESIAVPQPTPQPTPSLKEQNAQAAAGALELYVQLFEQGVTRNDYSPSYDAWELNACGVFEGDPQEVPGAWGGPCWMERFLIRDLNGDYIPELILASGEVEQEMFLYRAEGGKVRYASHCPTGNQEEINYAFHVYQDKEGNLIHLSEGVSGTGAGSAHTVHRVNADLSVSPLFYWFEDLDGNTYQVNGQEADEEEYKDAYEAYFSALTLVEKVEFAEMGGDPVAAVRAAAEQMR